MNKIAPHGDPRICVDLPVARRRVRVQFRDEFGIVRKIYVSDAESKVLEASNAANFKRDSTREMNLLHGLALDRSNYGHVTIREVRFISFSKPVILPKIFERCLQLKLNCVSWARFSRRPSAEPYKLMTPVTISV